MIVWLDPKNPGEIKDYRFDWTADLGADTILTAAAVFIAGSSAGMVISSVVVSNPFSVVWLSGGTVGETALVLGTITTTAGRTFQDVAQLAVVDPADIATLHSGTLAADRAAVYAARLAFITGGQIKEVWRDGRRITYATGSLADYDKALDRLDNQIAAAVAAEAGVGLRRFRALKPRFSSGW